jgi:hypothetical protein
VADHVFNADGFAVDPGCSEAGAYIYGFGEMEKWPLRDGVLDMAEMPRGIAFGWSRQHNEELFSSVAADEIGGTNISRHAMSCVTQDKVAGKMAERVVYFFEVVNVG